MPALRPRDEQAPLEHRLSQFLDKERHPVGLDDDLRRHFGGQWPAGDMLGQGLDLGGSQAVEPRAGRPGRGGRRAPQRAF
jgi:hypothetical protein